MIWLATVCVLTAAVFAFALAAVLCGCETVEQRREIMDADDHHRAPRYSAGEEVSP